MRNQALLRRITDHDAIIMQDRHAGCATYAAYPNGDRRRRPISWIEERLFLQFLSEGLIAKSGKGYAVVSSAARRARAMPSDQAHAAQHRDMESIVTTDAHGRFRPARINRNSGGVLERLARRKDASGAPFLSAAQRSAAEQFTRDYARSSLSVSITQNYMNVGGGATSGSGRGPEDASASALDAKARILDAMDYVGAPLNKTIMACCTQDMGLEDIERAQGWTQRSGATVLKIALQRLAEFYGTTPGLSARRH